MKKNARLKALLFERGLTGSELADRVSIPRAYLSLAMNGRFNLNAEEKERIAAALGVPVNEIFLDLEVAP
jgi:transcriptional regulator with XRE-family HTH domain